jgi:hypothetical protein
MRKLLFLLLLFAVVLPVRAAQQVTVEQLEQKLAAAHGTRDQALAKQLGDLELSERLSTQKLQSIQPGLPGEKSRQALLVLADASAFLDLPAAEIPAMAPLDAHTQNLILAKAAEGLVASMHEYPDFSAQETTSRFHDLKVSYLSRASEPIILEHQAFHPLDSFSRIVNYTNGKEVDEPTEMRFGLKRRPRNALSDLGVFGPLMRTVVTDLYKGKMEWGHWEQRATGPVAVFRYSIPKDGSNYVLKFCCMGLPGPLAAWHDFESIPPFHGEIAFDPATGAVYRLVLNIDLDPSDPLFLAKIVVEYEQVEMGGKMYTCPRKSVTITTAIAPTPHYGTCTGSAIETDCTPDRIFTPKDTVIDDTVYDSYRFIRAAPRMQPAESTAQQDTGQEDESPDADTPSSSTAPKP